MKTLNESILGSTNTGARTLIQKWCEDNKIYEGNFKINSDNTISPAGEVKYLRLRFDTYDRLPSYIKFKGDKNIKLFIGVTRLDKNATSWSNKIHIESFEGLPDYCEKLSINIKTYNPGIMPALSIKIEDSAVINTGYKECEKLELNFVNSSKEGKLNIHSNFKLGDPKIIVNNCKIITFVNDFNWGDGFSKRMIRKAVLNKYKNKYDFPASDEVENIIKESFPGFQYETLEAIEYTQNSKIVKHDGKWYRFKNW